MSQGGTLSDPAIALYQYASTSEGEVLTLVDANDDWRDHPLSTVIEGSYPPSTDAEAAIAIRLGPGQWVAKLYSTRSSEQGFDGSVSVTALSDQLEAQLDCTNPSTVPNLKEPPVIEDEEIIGNIPPIASITAPLQYQTFQIDFGQNPSFSGKGLSANPDAILSYEWDFDGDGIADSTDQNPGIHIYSLRGSITISLRVTDTQTGLFDIDTITIVVREKDNIESAPTVFSSGSLFQ